MEQGAKRRASRASAAASSTGAARSERQEPRAAVVALSSLKCSHCLSTAGSQSSLLSLLPRCSQARGRVCRAAPPRRPQPPCKSSHVMAAAPAGTASTERKSNARVSELSLVTHPSLEHEQPELFVFTTPASHLFCL